MKKWMTTALAATTAAACITLGTMVGPGSAAGSAPPPEAAASPAAVVAAAKGEPVRDQGGTQATPPNLENLYVPVEPCRVVDTRSGSPFGSGTTRAYYVAGTFGFAPQGGKSGGCGIPTGAKAVTATITAVDPSSVGFIRAWATGGTEPSATLLSYGTFSMGTGATVPIRPGAAQHLTVKNYAGPTDVVIDVTGYYIPQMEAYILYNGTISDQSGRLLSSTRTAAGTYTLQWDRDVTYCSVQATADYSAKYATAYTSGTYTYVYTFDSAGAPTDYYFNINVNC
ncbi:hypothetical protein GIS00_18485 [Nakamurella sp. YIM 132087]|uniref:Lipoprotein n=1 Tax=Nakamurella alba TaxID=2665158 RepID=A0A7K1FP50_9ACTN|nr:hypothetical protein [Nakamurella alba]MTD15926.1 hypothetical protein [Nakamurella alba]